MSAQIDIFAGGAQRLQMTDSIEQARAVALVASEVNTTAKLEVDMAKATDGDFKGSGFLDVDPRVSPRPKQIGGR